MKFDQPVPFREAIEQLAKKKLLPTDLTSAELRQLESGIRNQAFFSSQTTLEGLLDRYKTGIESIINPTQSERGATEGYDPASLRTFIKDYLRSISYKPDEGEAGTIKDLSSDGRINLVIKTNTELAHGAGRFIQQNSDADVVDLWPALELVRFESRVKPRDWEARWARAASYSGDTDAARMLEENGRMVARKDSPIWDALGSSDLFDDGLDNPFPPYAFNSGMWTQEISRDEAIELGLIKEGDKVEPQELDFGSLFNFGKS
jgi:hypothetical protein